LNLNFTLTRAAKSAHLTHDEKAFVLLYDNYSPALLGIIAKIVKDEAEAENLLQDSFVKIGRISANMTLKKVVYLRGCLIYPATPHLIFYGHLIFLKKVKSKIQNRLYIQKRYKLNLQK